ncbi:MAG: flavodoxin family protein [Candidatus Omnitrophota bacterium]
MKGLAIVGGPRKGQVTDRLVDAVLQGMKDKGIEVEKIYLYDFNIKPCNACLACKDSKKCVIDDHHQMVLDKMNKADYVVFSSPVYISNVTSVAKAFMDRSIRFFEQTKFGPRRHADKPSKVILITSCGAPFPFSHVLGIVPGCLNAMKTYFKYMNVKIQALAATGMGDFDVNSCKKLLGKAYSLGKNI